MSVRWDIRVWAVCLVVLILRNSLGLEPKQLVPQRILEILRTEQMRLLLENQELSSEGTVVKVESTGAISLLKNVEVVKLK